MNVSRSKGFALPTVLITSVVMLLMLLAGLVTTSSANTAVRGQYYDQLAKEAAESGISLMIGCIRTGDTIPAGTWKPDSTSCTNATVTGTKSPYVLDTYSNSGETKIRTRFEVGSPVDTGSGYYDISSTGYAVLYRGTSNAAATTIKRTVNLRIQYQSLFPSVSSSGSAFVCSILSGQTWCWGRNANAELGYGVLSSSPPYYGTSGNPVSVKTIRTNLGSYELDVAGGGQFACNLTVSKTTIPARYKVYCWGSQTDGRLGNGYGNAASTNYVTYPGGPANTGNPTSTNNVTFQGTAGDVIGGYPIQVEAGLRFGCVRLIKNISFGNVYCWGANGRGQLGRGSVNDGVDSNTPILVYDQNDTNAGLKASYINAGGSNACGIMSSNNVAVCWGDNGYNQIGDAALASGKSPYPRQVRYSDTTLFKVNKIVITQTDNAGDESAHACAISNSTTAADDNKIWCWGSDEWGQIGDGTANGTTTIQSPKKVTIAGDNSTYIAYDVAVSTHASCALVRIPPATEKELYCWGSNTQGEIGRNLDPNISGNDIKQVPGKIYEPFTDFSSKIKSIEGGGSRFCVVVGTSQYCWGLNHMGQIGDGTTGEDYSYTAYSARFKPTKSLFLEPLYTGIAY